MPGGLLRLSSSWWRLPGPDRFLSRIAEAANKPLGVVGLLLPHPEPQGWLEAVRERLDEQASSQPIVVDASAGLRGRSPVRVLAAAAGLETSGLRVIQQFLDEPALADAVFVVHGAPVGDWREWSLFLRTFRADHAGVERAGAPTILFTIPPPVLPGDARAALGGAPLRWSGMVSRLDTRLYVEATAGRGDDDLVARVAAETVVELAGWEQTLADALTRLPVRQQLEPLNHLAPYAAEFAGLTPSWGNGLVDWWDGQPHVSTLALLATGDRTTLDARIWSAQVRVVFPFLNTVRLAFATRYEDALRARLPYTKIYGERRQVYTDPYRLEFYDIKHLLEQVLSQDQALLLDDCLKLRRSMAHSEPADAYRIARVSERWEQLEPDFPAASTGWEWPRCGQSMVVMVGPSCAGKSTYAEAHYDRADIISSDAIRLEIFGSLEAAGDQGPVFEQLRADVRARLSAGHRVVVDATHIKAVDRLATARLMPADMPVEYVVLDRPMADKVTTAGWRAARPGLLEAHGTMFMDGLDAIMAGDGLPNVTVTALLPDRKEDADAA